MGIHPGASRSLIDRYLSRLVCAHRRQLLRTAGVLVHVFVVVSMCGRVLVVVCVRLYVCMYVCVCVCVCVW